MKAHPMTSKGLPLIFTLLLSGCIFEDTNTEPVASDVEIAESNGLADIVISNATLLENVTDNSVSSLSITEVSLVSGSGTLVETDSGWTYTPAINDLGDIRFSYSVSDGEYTDTASISTSISNGSRTRISSVAGITLHSTIDLTSHANVTATLYLGNSSYDLEPMVDDGSFAFIDIPSSSSYLLEIKDNDNVFATHYSAGLLESGTLPSLQDANITNLSSPSVTTVELISATNGLKVDGLEPFILINDVINADRTIPNLAEKRLYLTESADGYTFLLDTQTESVNVYVESLTSSTGVDYTAVANDFTLPVLTQLQTGESDSIYLARLTNTAYMVTLQLKDTSANDFDAGPLLAVLNRVTGETEFWTKVAGTVGSYVFEVAAEQISHSRVLQPVDNNDDGVVDFTANPEANGFPLLNALTLSDFDGNNEVVKDLVVSSTDYSSTLRANRVSSDNDFQSKGLAQVTFAFNRPVSAPLSVELISRSLTASRPNIALNTTAEIFESDQLTAATTDQGQSSLELNYDNSYTYSDKDAQSISLAFGANGSDEVQSSFVTEYDVTESSTPLTTANYQLTNGNTLLTITLNSSAVVPMGYYEFSFIVDAPLDDFGTSSFSFDLRAQTGESTSLSDITLDNFNFKDDQTFSAIDSTAEQYLDGLEPDTDQFFTLDVGYDAGATSNRAELKFVSRDVNGLPEVSALNTDSGIDSGDNVVYLVSEAPLTGSITLLNQTEVFDDGGSESSLKTDLTGPTYTMTLDDSAGTNEISGNPLYIATHPANHGVEQSGVTAALGVALISGANVSEQGVYYVYELPLSPVTAGRVSKVEIEFDVVISNVVVTGQKEYQIN